MGTIKRIKITHLYDRNTDSLIIIEEYLKYSLELGVSEIVLKFIEEKLNSIK